MSRYHWTSFGPRPQVLYCPYGTRTQRDLVVAGTAGAKVALQILLRRSAGAHLAPSMFINTRLPTKLHCWQRNLSDRRYRSTCATKHSAATRVGRAYQQLSHVQPPQTNLQTHLTGFRSAAHHLVPQGGIVGDGGVRTLREAWDREATLDFPGGL